MESLELGRNLKRNCVNLASKKRVALLVISGLVIIIYIIPYLTSWYRNPVAHVDVIEVCLNDRLSAFTSDFSEFNAYVGYLPPKKLGNPNFVGYVGNGYFGLDVVNDDQLYIRRGRHLSLPTAIYPLLLVKNNLGVHRSAYVNNYRTGIVHVYQCYDNGFYTSFQYYAHRRAPSLFVQEIKLSNPSDHNIDVIFETRPLSSLHASTTRSLELRDGENRIYNLTSGWVAEGDEPEIGIPISVVHRSTPSVIKVEARSSKNVIYLTALSYGNRRKFDDKTDGSLRKKIENAATSALTQSPVELSRLKEQHAQAWHNLWTTGFSIETSKAKDALNGDKINATLYYVLSQVKDGSDLSEIVSTLSYSEGCYGNHHTLEAPNLWGSLDSVDELNNIASYWLLTLEKNGCHNMVRAGARGVAHAMILSLGGLRFSNQHLEFNIDPKYLHRGSLFHRIGYGNRTHVNISVVVAEDNKAVLQVSVDRSDNKYYACDAGCLDTPVLLGHQPVTFPVKLTEPLTPILYVTYDKQHMEELRKAIHVREIGVAPAHEHHVIALHKHGHHLGGLPTFFWVSVSILILIFHLFLFKLIYNEYCASNNNNFDRQRFRYGKL